MLGGRLAGKSARSEHNGGNARRKIKYVNFRLSKDDFGVNFHLSKDVFDYFGSNFD